MELDAIYLILAGIVGGFVAGLLGIGGGLIYILVLPIFLTKYGVCSDKLVPYIIANSIITVLMVSLSANVKRVINGTFQWKEVGYIGFFGACSSVLCMQFIVQSQWYSKLYFNIVVSLLMLFMLIRMVKEFKTEKKEGGVVQLMIVGVLAGAASALSGLGGGVIVVPMMLYLFAMDVKKAKTISLGVIGVMALSLTVKNLLWGDLCTEPIDYSIGYIIAPVTAMLAIGVVIGTQIGVKVSEKMNSKHLKMLFALMLLIVIVKKFYEIATELQWL